MTISTLSDITTREQLAEALTQAREAAGLSVRAVARALRMPPSTAGGYFAGRHLPPPGELQRLLHACRVPEDELEDWLDAARRVRVNTDRRVNRTRAPYRGLDAYGAEDADLFHGRVDVTAHIADLVLDGTPLVAVVGASGSGKSSILRAGAGPALRARGLTCAVITPGADPAVTLAQALVDAPDVLVVDQFEEIFTLAPAAERADFLARLSSAGPRVVMGLRVDFYPSAAEHAPLRAALQTAQVLVGPMDEQDMRAAITGPATVVGAEVEEALVDLLLAELRPQRRSESGALPLLSYALLACWDRSRTGRLTVADYRATGGIDGAIQRTADQLYAQLSPPQQALARRIFLRLVTVEGDVAVTRRLLSWDELDALDTSGQGLEIVGRFVDQRLLVAGLEHVEVSHEALLSAWPRLRAWVGQDRAELRLQRQISLAANEWHQHGRDPSLLWRGLRLAAATELRADPVANAELTERERAFTDAGAAQAALEATRERRRTKRLQAVLAVAVVMLVVAAALGIVAERAQRRASSARDDALSRQVAVTALQLRQSNPALAQQLILVANRIASTTVSRAAMLDGSASSILTRVLGQPGPTPLGLSRDGRLVAVGNAVDGSLRLYRTRANRPPIPLARITGSRPVLQEFAIEFSPDGRTLAAGGQDKHVRLWDITNPAAPQLRATLGPDFGGSVQSIAFSPDGGTVIAASNGAHPVQEWDVRDLSAVRPMPPLSGIAAGTTIQSVAIDRSGRVAAAGSGGTIYVWPRVSGGIPVRLTSEPVTINAVAFDPRRPVLFAGDTSGTVQVWNLASPGTKPGSIETGSLSPVNRLAVSPDGTKVATGNAANTVSQYLAEPNRTQALTTTSGGGPVTGLAYSPDGTLLYLANADGTLRIRTSSASGIPVLGTAFNVVYDRGYTRLAVFTNGTDGVRLWNPRTGTPYGPALQIPKTGVGGSGTMSPDGSLVVAGDLSGRIMLWDTRDPAHPRVTAGPIQVASAIIETVAINPAGTVIAVSSDDGSITLMDVENPRAPRKLAVVRGTQIMFGAAFNRDGTLLAGANEDTTVSVWDVRDLVHPRAVAKLTGFLTYVYGVTFSPTENVLAAASSDHTVRLWDLATPSRPTPVGPTRVGPTDYVYSTAFSPDGAHFAAASNDRTVRIYRVHSGRDAVPDITLQQPNAPVWTVTYSPDGTMLTSGGRDSTLSTWSLDPSVFARRLCAGAGDAITRDEWALYVPGAAYDPPCR